MHWCIDKLQDPATASQRSTPRQANSGEEHWANRCKANVEQQQILYAKILAVWASLCALPELLDLQLDWTGCSLYSSKSYLVGT